MRIDDNILPALYVHIPFCRKRCFFCSFATAVGQLSRSDEYLQQLGREAAGYAGQAVGSIYIGGGTPSCLESDGIAELWRHIALNFRFDDICEKTFEANPESLTPEKAGQLAGLGVTRVSLGVQSFNDERLAFLGRAHVRQDALRAFGLLRSFGFGNVSVDLMYGFPQQTAEELARDVDEIIALGSDHVSVYSLTVEDRSLFQARKMAVDSDAQAGAYELVRRKLETAGLRQYEISNFARPGSESVHNINYWRGGEYIGLGMAAHSHLAGRRFWNGDTFPLYMRLMAERGSALAGEERLEGVERLTEIFLFGLRMNEGVDLDSLERKIGVELPQDRKEALESFFELGLLEDSGGRIRTTDRGRLVLDEISARIV